MSSEDIARIDELILTIRGQRVILAAHLARIYGVETRVLNQAVKRNLEKFPADFTFQLTPEEAEEVQRSRSQIVILKRGANIRLPAPRRRPIGFRAVKRNRERFPEDFMFRLTEAEKAEVITNCDHLRPLRAFARLREILATHKDLARKLEELEKKYDAQFKVVFDAIRQLMAPPEKARRSIGFRVEEAGPTYRPRRRSNRTWR